VLSKLLRSHLRPYKSVLILIVVLQAVQTTAALALPTINARIIDNGVLHRVGMRVVPDQGYIYTWGAIMVAFAFIQSNEQYSRIFGHFAASTLSPKKSAILRISPGMSRFKSA